MTLPAGPITATDSGDGVTTEYSLPFKFFANSDIYVTLIEKATGVLNDQVLDVDYTVQGALDPNGGSVTFFVAPSSDFDVFRGNNLPIDQIARFINLSVFPAELVEVTFDRVVTQLKTFDDALERVFRLPIGSQASAELPPYAPGQYLGWSATEQELTNLPAPVVSEEALTFSNGLEKTPTGPGASDVAVLLASTNPGLQFIAGALKALADGLTMEVVSAGMQLRTAEQAETIAGGVANVTGINMVIDTEAAAGTDDLDTLNVGSMPTGVRITVRQAVAARDVVIKHGTGNIFLRDGVDVTLDDGVKSIELQRRGANWAEVSRSFDTPPALSAKYLSGEITLTTTSDSFLTHNLGGPPEIVDCELVCKTADLGYSPGDVVKIGRNNENDVNINAGFTIRTTGTFVVVQFGGFLGMVINNKAKTAQLSITPANWKLVVRAFR